MTTAHILSRTRVSRRAIVPLVLALASLAPAQAQTPPSRQAPRPPAAAPAAPAVQQPAAAPSTLPNGASSINEVYADWTIDCRMNEGEKFCALSQAQGNGQTGQRVFAIELRAPKDGRTEGTILMPFGLKLDTGAILKLDDKDLGQGLRFSTCVPQGCLLPVSFPTVATDAMKQGQKLVVASLNLSSNEPVTFTVSLNGFTAALARLSQLAG